MSIIYQLIPKLMLTRLRSSVDELVSPLSNERPTTYSRFEQVGSEFPSPLSREDFFSFGTIVPQYYVTFTLSGNFKVINRILNTTKT